jgi:hypothetical protein
MSRSPPIDLLVCLGRYTKKAKKIIHSAVL